MIDGQTDWREGRRGMEERRKDGTVGLAGRFGAFGLKTRKIFVLNTFLRLL